MRRVTSDTELLVGFAPRGAGFVRLDADTRDATDLLLADLPAAIRLRDALDDLVHQLVLDKVRADGTLALAAFGG